MRVYVFACVSALRLLTTSDVMWHDMDCIIKFYGFYMAAVVDIISEHDVSIHTHRGN